MGLRQTLRRAAVSRPGVLLVAWPGATALRLAAEAELCRLDWPVVEGPAAANLLVVVGAPESVDAGWLESVWGQMPSPKARVTVPSPDRVREELAAAHSLLEAAAQEEPPAGSPPVSGMEHGQHGHGRHPGQDAHPNDKGDHHHGHDGKPADPHRHLKDHGEPKDPHRLHEHEEPADHHEQHADHQASAEDHAHGDHGGHEGHTGHESHADQQEHGAHHAGHDMGHAGHDMGDMTIAGLPMADRADDRDELRLDRLHVALGPALGDWPTGLILRVSLQGDVVQEADAEHVKLRAYGDPYWNDPWLRAVRGDEVTRDEAARRRCAAHLDSLGRLLAVAGWADAAVRARRMRDEVLAGARSDRMGDDLQGLVRRVSRSRTLRWLTVGLGPLPASRAHELGISGPALVADGDVHDRVRVWLDEAAGAVDGLGDRRPLARDEATGPRGRVDGARPPSVALLAALPELLRGTEFAAARLIVASLDPDVDELVAVPAQGMAHG
ncbi:hypothetical protein ABZ214_30235 [Streptomyces iakyrus]|uniref:hypothetical protein n=1 Tax=Streptomyces iakyrus TaxID=68219 RepID=UPI0033B92179